MDTQLAETEVVVVGGGLAGLSAACYLARAGVGVTLFEQAAALGGRAATQYHAGYAFNRGVHALYYGGAATQVFKDLGVAYSGGRPQGLWMRHAGRPHLFPAGPLTLLRTDLLAAGDKAELTRLLTGLMLQKAATLGGVSTQTWLAGHARRPTVRRVLAGLARTYTYTAALDQVSAEVFVTQLQLSVRHNVRYIDGGWGSFVTRLRRIAERAGVRIITGTGVAAVTPAGEPALGVRLRDGHTVGATAVIVATPAPDAVRLVGGEAGAALAAAVAGRAPVAVACLDVALRRLPAPHYPVVLDADQPRFQTVQSLFARIAPPGGALVHTARYLDPAHPTDLHADERELEALLDAVQPGWQAEVVKRIYLPRIEAVSLLPTARGGGLAGRPGVTVPGAAGLYLAGDWVGAEGYLVDASLASARESDGRLLQGDLAALRTGAARVPVAAGR